MTSSAKVAGAPEAVCPLLNGMKIPQLILKDAFGAVFDLSAAIAQRPAVLVFYRGGW